MNSQTVLTDINSAGVATVCLNRAEKHNAFDDQVIADLTDSFVSVANASAKVMILRSEGKSFSAGADLSWMQRMANYSYEENLRDAEALAAMLKTLDELPMPTIARVQGAAYGGAVGLVSCCDIAVGGPKASFALSEAKIGLVPATISPYVISAIGERSARRYFQTAERFDANRALALNLLSEVVEEDQLDSTIDGLVSTLLANSPAAVRAGKKLVRDVTNQPKTDELILKTSELIASIRVSEEGQQGLMAFLEKRPAPWIDQSNTK